eukprot:4359338-Alexandrium_andersonii.AAC.1
MPTHTNQPHHLKQRSTLPPLPTTHYTHRPATLPTTHGQSAYTPAKPHLAFHFTTPNTSPCMTPLYNVPVIISSAPLEMFAILYSTSTHHQP